MPVVFSQSDSRYWLALHRVPGVGSVTFQALLKKIGDPREIFRQNRKTLIAFGLGDRVLRHIQNPDWDKVDRDLLWLDKPGNHLVAICDPRYPTALKEISDPPPLLFVHGNVSALGQPQIAIVGSRNPTPMGMKHAHEFAYSLASSGLSITSGLALGIDGASHQGALAGGGETIAVTGNGLDRVYPARHKSLATTIGRNGALVSEFPPGTPPSANNFPRRNRIISGLSLGTLVIEAAVNSGSLITARMAMEQGREVFAVPGSIQNPLSRGCHALLRDGAKLVETVQDIFDEVEHIVCSPPTPPILLELETGLEKDHKNLLECIAYDSTAVDTLVEVTGESPEAIASMLLVLELKGFISSAAGGCYYRVK